MLGRLAGTPRGTRVASAALNNLPMVAGASPIAPYRTLDLPTLSALTRLSMEIPGRPETDPGLIAALRATGTGVRVFDPFESAQIKVGATTILDREALRTIRDPVLAGWLYGAPWVAENGPYASTFTVWNPESPAPGPGSSP